MVIVHTFQTKEVIDILLSGEDYYAKLNMRYFHTVKSRYTWLKSIINSKTSLSIPDEDNVIYGFCNLMNDYQQLRSFSYYLPEICQYFKLRPSERIMLELQVPDECVVYTDYGKEIYKEEDFIISKEEFDATERYQVMLPFIKAEWLVDIIDIVDSEVTERHFKDLSETFEYRNSKKEYIWSFKPRNKSGIMKDDIDLIYSNGFNDEWKTAITETWYKKGYVYSNNE